MSPPATPAPPGGAAERERAFGLILFDAEESLARGQAEKALVSASKAMRERPESLTARSLFERARRELLRGRRKGKLEARLVEARSLLDGGDFKAAEKIVGAALKLVPDNAVALELFGRLKERRLQSGTVEAEADRELDRLARERAHRSAEAARGALRSGATPRALLAVRRALRLVPDDPDLLSVLAQIQESLERTEAGRAARRAMQGQVRRASELLRGGQLGDGLKMLRTVLFEDPDFGPAQDAVQEARRLWLARADQRASVPPVPAVKPSPAPAADRATRAPVVAKAAPLPAPTDSPARPPLRAPLARPAGEPVIPPEIRLPAGARRATPWRLILGGVAVIVVGTILLLGRVDHPTPVTPGGGRGTPVPSTLAPPPEPDDTGPLAAVDPDLRKAINAVLAAYGRALETVDAQALQAARPDLSAEERESLLAPLRGALNVATDLRVLDVIRNGEGVTVPVLRTDVVVGGRAISSPPVEETLRFERADGAWALKVPRR